MKYRELKGWKYELVEPLSVAVPELRDISVEQPYIKLSDGILKVEAGYAWDGATGVPDNPDNMRGSLFHDALYQLIREGLLDRKYKNFADALLRQICLEDGMGKFWADFIYKGVQMFGKGAVLPRKRPKGQIIEI